MKIKALILILILLQVLFVNTGSSVIITTDIMFQCDNENYTVNSTMTFSTIIVNQSDITFNSTVFNISSTNPINITIAFINSDMANASANELILAFYANTTGGTVWFNISGLSANTQYDVTESVNQTFTSNTTGVVSFSNDVWSEQYFEISRVSAPAPVKGETFGEEREAQEIRSDVLFLIFLMVILSIVTFLILISGEKEYN